MDQERGEAPRAGDGMVHSIAAEEDRGRPLDERDAGMIDRELQRSRCLQALLTIFFQLFSPHLSSEDLAEHLREVIRHSFLLLLHTEIVHRLLIQAVPFAQRSFGYITYFVPMSFVDIAQRLYSFDFQSVYQHHRVRPVGPAAAVRPVGRAVPQAVGLVVALEAVGPEAARVVLATAAAVAAVVPEAGVPEAGAAVDPGAAVAAAVPATTAAVVAVVSEASVQEAVSADVPGAAVAAVPAAVVPFDMWTRTTCAPHHATRNCTLLSNETEHDGNDLGYTVGFGDEACCEEVIEAC